MTHEKLTPEEVNQYIDAALGNDQCAYSDIVGAPTEDAAGRVAMRYLHVVRCCFPWIDCRQVTRGRLEQVGRRLWAETH